MLFRLVVLIALILFGVAEAATADGQQKNAGLGGKSSDSQVAAVDKNTVVTVGNRARLCNKPNAGTDGTVARLTTGSVLEVLETQDVQLPKWNVKWYRVTYKGKKGWVSEFDTNRAPTKPRGIK